MTETDVLLAKERRAPTAGRAVIAANHGKGVVLWHDGVLEALMDGTGPQINDLGLDDAPDGISVWEGAIKGGEWLRGSDDYADIFPEGAFRAPTPEEWQAIHSNRSPWPAPELPDEAPNAL